MRRINSSAIEDAVCGAFLEANYRISPSIKNAMESGISRERTETAANILRQICESYEISEKESMPICQDCGMAIVFAGIGQDVHIDGDFNKAVQSGVRRAYQEGYLRKSVVRDPIFDRSNTGDNTPAIVYTELTRGDRIKITAVSKGFGSENKSAIKLFLPTASVESIEDFIADTAVNAGASACPPLIVGVGIGGTIEKAAMMAKLATTREVGSMNPDSSYQAMEMRILDRINSSGIGPAGLGGSLTAMAVHIEKFPTHIASIPVAVNICCHASRHATVIL